MTMIRINLIAEKKQGTAKAAKKVSKQSPQVQRLQENGIIAGLVVVGLIIAYFWNNSFDKKAIEAEAEVKALKATYEGLKGWEDKQKEFEIRKQLLDQKIQKISGLKEDRGTLVKMLEDIYNNLPDNMWISSISSGVEEKFKRVEPGYRKVLKAKTGKLSVADDSMIAISGYSRSSDAVSNFTKSLQALDTRYTDVDLSIIDRPEERNVNVLDPTPGVYSFVIYMRPVRQNAPAEPAEAVEDTAKKKKS